MASSIRIVVLLFTTSKERPLVGLEKRTPSASVLSATRSLTVLTLMIPLIVPATKVKVPTTEV